jgi:hypothetical protein
VWCRVNYTRGQTSAKALPKRASWQTRPKGRAPSGIGIRYLANTIGWVTISSASKTHLITTLHIVQLRAPTKPPSPLQHRQLPILFRHPGYDDGSNVLFRLQAPDTDDDGQPGLLAQFAIDACVIIAGDYAGGRGWLSLLRDGSALIDPISTLRERSYYSHLDAATDPYPIVPNFRQWKYPHDRLPAHWQQLSPDTNPASSSPSNLTASLLMRDGSCRVVDWYKANDMSQYNTSPTATLDDTAYALLLCANLHIAFDKPRFAFAPKLATDGSMRLVAHLLAWAGASVSRSRAAPHRGRRGGVIPRAPGAAWDTGCSSIRPVCSRH